MNKRQKTLKFLPVYCAVSAVIIIAGIILFALLGFNYGAEKPEYKSFEVQYNVVAGVEKYEDQIEKTCEDAFAANGISFDGKKLKEELGGNYSSETGNKLLVYTFAAKTADSALQAAMESVKTELAGKFASCEGTVAVHTVTNSRFTEALWRAAVAVAVGSVVGLIYIGIRFGVGAALSGLVSCTNSVFFTLAFFAVTRIPLFASAPLLYAAVAAFVSLLLWLLHLMKMRENFKDPSFASFSAEEAVAASVQSSDKLVFGTTGAIGLIVLIFGLIASAGVRALVLPVLVPVAVGLYSSTLLAPALHVHVKKAFDRWKANRKRNKYVGKKKKEAKTEVEEAK